MGFVFILLLRRSLFVFEDFRVGKGFRFVCECPKQVCRYHLECFPDYLILLHHVLRLRFLQYVDQLDQALFLVFFQVSVLFGICKVAVVVEASSEFGEVNNRPLFGVRI